MKYNFYSLCYITPNNAMSNQKTKYKALARTRKQRLNSVYSLAMILIAISGTYCLASWLTMPDHELLQKCKATHSVDFCYKKFFGWPASPHKDDGPLIHISHAIQCGIFVDVFYRYWIRGMVGELARSHKVPRNLHNKYQISSPLLHTNTTL